ncbi:MAG: ATP-binding protein [Chloroflexi bacterium]|nr:ATP-binding protein [Chloroflexota bacterium]MCI0576641.1 ATP-binding protein [Chloroflexota bacterium]MCI0646991.1 ATP-binding protein [Chloroflexota bacterium]MCI0730691.1 ATP-binding protein [Chloroflexota bacterium]
MFVDRTRELLFLRQTLSRQDRGQMLLLYGRRRVGKTELLRQWAVTSGLSYTYWMAEKEPAALQRRKLFSRLLDVPVHQAVDFSSWSELWDWIAPRLVSRRQIIILDELPYAAAADSAMLSALQYAWDHYFQNSPVILVLCGSQVNLMSTIMTHQSPLFGRLTGQWYLQPLPFAALRHFFPDWSAEERVAAYAIVGGVPAYLQWLDRNRSLSENIRQVITAQGSMFLAEPNLLLYDEVREPAVYLAILQAIGAGYHTPKEIGETSLIGQTHLSAYLRTLQELRLVKRHLPATLTTAQRRRSRQGRYRLADAYLRFYFRFLAPHLDQLLFTPEAVLEHIQKELRAFVGQTAFEELAQEWVAARGRAGTVPFAPQAVGSHWSKRVQVDVAAINWDSHDVLLGECKWGTEHVDKGTVRTVIEQKTARLLQDLTPLGEEWRVHYAFFARAGYTPAALASLREVDGLGVDLAQLDQELEE